MTAAGIVLRVVPAIGLLVLAAIIFTVGGCRRGSRAARIEIPAPAPEWEVRVKPRNWQYIVVHHSATEVGCAEKFDRYHRETHGWRDGLGYHFVIGNGTDTWDGQVEVGGRWTRQIRGAHASSFKNYFNKFGIGICLVGNLDDSRPTRRQMESLTRLVRWLQATYRVPRSYVIGHCDVSETKSCPGDYFPWRSFLAGTYRALPPAPPRPGAGRR